MPSSTHSPIESEFSPEEIQIVNAVERFVREKVTPDVGRLEKEAVYPEQLVNAMKEMGLFGIAIPEHFGGLNLRLPVFAKVIEEIAKGWTSLAAYINSHCTVAYVIAKHGTQDQKEEYLHRMATGELRGALCLTESGAGSDLQAIKTTAIFDGHQYRLRGNKIFVTNGGRASVLLTLAKTDPKAEIPKRGMSLMLVHNFSEGVKVAGVFHKMAYGLVDTVEIDMDAVLPKQALLGGVEGKGLSQLLDGLDVGRIAIAASAVGLAAAALGEACKYAAQRSAFGVSINQHQAVQLRLADMATQLVAARLLTMEAARTKGLGFRSNMISGMAKLFASEACYEITGQALRIHGGYGYINEFSVERMFREAPLYIVGEGTNDIQKLVIARGLLEENEPLFLGLPK